MGGEMKVWYVDDARHEKMGGNIKTITSILEGKQDQKRNGNVDKCGSGMMKNEELLSQR